MSLPLSQENHFLSDFMSYLPYCSTFMDERNKIEKQLTEKVATQTANISEKMAMTRYEDKTDSEEF